MLHVAPEHTKCNNNQAEQGRTLCRGKRTNYYLVKDRKRNMRLQTQVEFTLCHQPKSFTTQYYELVK